VCNPPVVLKYRLQSRGTKSHSWHLVQDHQIKGAAPEFQPLLLTILQVTGYAKHPGIARHLSPNPFFSLKKRKESVWRKEKRIAICLWQIAMPTDKSAVLFLISPDMLLWTQWEFQFHVAFAMQIYFVNLQIRRKKQVFSSSLRFCFAKPSNPRLPPLLFAEQTVKRWSLLQQIAKTAIFH